MTLIVVALLAALYFSGRLDPVLYKVGLNYGPCGQNAFGSVYCGSQLTSYNQRIQGIQRQYQDTMRTITQNEQSQLRAITQQECTADPSLPGCP